MLLYLYTTAGPGSYVTITGDYMCSEWELCADKPSGSCSLM